MAQWSPIWQEWKDGHTSRAERDSLLRQARLTPPAAPKKKTGGKYPHLQRMR